VGNITLRCVVSKCTSYLSGLEKAVRERLGLGVRIYACSRLLSDGKDVTRYVKGVYNHNDRAIYLTIYADTNTVVHEIAHALDAQRNPWLYENIERMPEEERIREASKMEKRARQTEEEIKALLGTEQISRWLEEAKNCLINE